MASVLIEDLPPATAEFLHRRARRAGASSVADHLRFELITLASERAPIDNVVELAAEGGSRPLPQPEIDDDATVLSNTYNLPNDVWDTFCIRAAATGVPVSDYVHQELVALSRRATIDDAMWELGEVQAANPSLDIDFEAALKAMRYARGLD
jgi:plasmid stability protein